MVRKELMQLVILIDRQRLNEINPGPHDESFKKTQTTKSVGANGSRQ